MTIQLLGRLGTARTLEAERMLVEAMTMRDDAVACFDRATQMALEFAQIPKPLPDDDEDRIPF